MDREADFRDWAIQLVQAQAWPWALMAQILDEKGVVSLNELRTRHEGALVAMKQISVKGLAVPTESRPDIMLMQALVDMLTDLEAQAKGKPKPTAN